MAFFWPALMWSLLGGLWSTTILWEDPRASVWSFRANLTSRLAMFLQSGTLGTADTRSVRQTTVNACSFVVGPSSSEELCGHRRAEHISYEVMRPLI